MTPTTGPRLLTLRLAASDSSSGSRSVRKPSTLDRIQAGRSTTATSLPSAGGASGGERRGWRSASAASLRRSSTVATASASGNRGPGGTRVVAVAVATRQSTSCISPRYVAAARAAERSAAAAVCERGSQPVERCLGRVRVDRSIGQECEQQESPVCVSDEPGESVNARERPGLGPYDAGAVTARATSIAVGQRAGESCYRKARRDRTQLGTGRNQTQRGDEHSRRQPVEGRQPAAVDELCRRGRHARLRQGGGDGGGAAGELRRLTLPKRRRPGQRLREVVVTVGQHALDEGAHGW